jgi:hypothetical protein
MLYRIEEYLLQHSNPLQSNRAYHTIGNLGNFIRADGDTAIISSATVEKLQNGTRPLTLMENATIMKLCLDSMYQHQSFNVATMVSDRLSCNIIAFPDAGIEDIARQSKHRSDIALMAISEPTEIN